MHVHIRIWQNKNFSVYNCLPRLHHATAIHLVSRIESSITSPLSDYRKLGSQRPANSYWILLTLFHYGALGVSAVSVSYLFVVDNQDMFSRFKKNYAIFYLKNFILEDDF